MNMMHTYYIWFYISKYILFKCIYKILELDGHLIITLGLYLATPIPLLKVIGGWLPSPWWFRTTPCPCSCFPSGKLVLAEYVKWIIPRPFHILNTFFLGLRVKDIKLWHHRYRHWYISMPVLTLSFHFFPGIVYKEFRHVTRDKTFYCEDTLWI